MLSNIPEMPQHLILALDHHRQLLEDARRQRAYALVRSAREERPLWWRRVRVSVGELLIRMGQRLTTNVPTSQAEAKAAWK